MASSAAPVKLWKYKPSAAPFTCRALGSSHYSCACVSTKRRIAQHIAREWVDIAFQHLGDPGARQLAGGGCQDMDMLDIFTLARRREMIGEGQPIRRNPFAQRGANMPIDRFRRRQWKAWLHAKHK